MTSTTVAQMGMSDRPRVMHVVVAGSIGGAERLVEDLASRPDETRAEHVVALMTPNPDLARLFANAGLRVVDRGPVRENRAAYLWRSLGPLDAAWLVRRMRDERAAIAHLHTFASQVVGTRAARAAGLCTLRTEHSTRVYDDPKCWAFSRWSLRRADASVAVSMHVQERALARAPWARDRMQVIHNGVDTDRFAPRSLPPTSEVLRLVLVGRLEPRKGVDVAIDAVAQVPGTTLSILGDGEERAALEARVRAYGMGDRVTFFGYVPDPRVLLAGADVALCSSRAEGLGIALLEAMAMGKPVLSFRVGGVPEFVIDEETGWLVRDSTASALAARLRDVVRAPVRVVVLGRAARALTERSFSMHRMCASYARVYARLTEVERQSQREDTGASLATTRSSRS